MLKPMPTDQLQLFLTMATMIGGLLLFALLLLVGVRMVRWLNLPQELPEGPRFEPPPPPTVAKGNRAQAAVVATTQATLSALYAQAHQAVRAAFETQEIHQFATSVITTESTKSISETTARCAATANAAGTAVEQTLLAFGTLIRTDRQELTDAKITQTRTVIDTHLVTIQGALNEARAAVEPLGDGGGNRRILILVVILIVMVVWVVAMQSLMKP
jgi:hypothetical protein